MCLPIDQLVQRIHGSPGRVALAVTGGGSRAIAMLLEVPGASRTLIEAVVPYSERSLADYLSGPPDHACSAQTARSMAMAAMFRARCNEEPDVPTAGVACTAGLASDRPKRGPHRAHVAIQTVELTETWSVEFQKGRRSRAEEEQVVARLVLGAVAEACGLDDRVGLDLLDGERVEHSRTVAPLAWQDLLLGSCDAVRHGGTVDEPDTSEAPGRVIFSGAFNPVHAGHRRMVQVAGEILGRPVELELPILNADKPPLDYHELRRRLDQFDPTQAVWLTRSATFVEKSRLFPGTTFVVGADTLARIAEPRFYGGQPTARDAALAEFARRGCRFLVFGRDTGGGFHNQSDLDLPEQLASLCHTVPAAQFRADISSTELRRQGKW